MQGGHYASTRVGATAAVGQADAHTHTHRMCTRVPRLSALEYVHGKSFRAVSHFSLSAPWRRFS